MSWQIQALWKVSDYDEGLVAGVEKWVGGGFWARRVAGEGNGNEL